MKHIRIIYYTGLYCALTLNSAAFCMRTQLARANKTKYHRTCFVKSYDDTVQGRRNAYQKWCPIKIEWPNNNNEIKIQPQHNTDHIQEDTMAYYKQFTKK